MTDIELVIKIPEEDYLVYSELSEKEKVNELTYYEKIIAYGAPLPKGHGRLIDEKDLSLMTVHLVDGMLVCDAPTIIEADKGDEAND